MKTMKSFFAALLLLSSISSLPVSADLIMSAPPRGKAETEQKVYEPLAAYISQVIGQKVVYQHPENWGIYQAEMQQGKYDIVFDGPHFAQWRVVKKNHEILVKTPGELVFMVVVKDEDQKYQKLSDLRGRRLCGLAPPNLATLTIFKEFGIAQPNLVLSQSFQSAFNEMLAGKCAAVILADRMYKNLAAKEVKKSRVIYTSKGFPNQTITAGKKLKIEQKELLKNRLLTPEANAAITAFIKQYTGGKGLVPANPEDYKGMELLLKDSWGFGV